VVSVTTGGRVWQAVLTALSRQDSVTVDQVREEMNDPPSRQTIYRRLESTTELDVILKEPGKGSAPSVYLDPNADSRAEIGRAQPEELDYPL